MNTILAITWTWGEVTTFIEAACIAIPILLTLVAGLALKVYAVYVDLRTKVAQLNEKSAEHGTDIKANNNKIIEVALATTPPQTAATVSAIQEIKDKIDELKPKE